MEPPVHAVDRARLMAHTAQFAKRVKLSGTAEEAASFEYLRQAMAAEGFRTTLLHHDAFISLPGPATLQVDGVAVACITHSMSVPTGPAGLAAPLVHVGPGTAADFARVDVRGKAVLIDGIALEDAADLATRAGALAQIHISPTEHLYEMCISTVWGSPSANTRPNLPATAAATISHKDGARLRDRCARGDPPAIHLVTAVDTGWRPTPLLVCDMDAPGAGPETPFILFSGHHDTWHLGVMDNGTANATMLEAARVLAAHRGSWHRSLRVCFWSGHSHGRYSGSAFYADEHWAELDLRCAAHVNIDSTGGVGADVLAGPTASDELQAVAMDAVCAETGQTGPARRHGRVADMSFWGIGVPSMFGSLSRQPPRPGEAHMPLGWWWHTPHDTLDRVDPAALERDSRVVVRALWTLTTSRTLPFDYALFADRLLDELASLQAALAERLDLRPLQAAAEALRDSASHLPTPTTDAASHTLDQALIRASRHLVPLNYTSGNRFHPDPALTLPPWPSLEPMRGLALATRDDTAFHMVDARRARNLVLDALQRATSCLRAAAIGNTR